MDSMAKTEADNPDNNNYSSLFFKYAGDSNLSRTSSLVEDIRTPTMSIGTEDDPEVTASFPVKEPESPTEDEVFPGWKNDTSLLDSIDLTDMTVDLPREPAIHPDSAFLQDMEPSASPTLGGLSYWRNVSEVDSDQLIAKSKE